MSWHKGEHCREVDPEIINEDWANVPGDLTQEEAGVWLSRFLASHPFQSLKFLTGLANVHAIQDILIRIWFQRDFNLLVAGRGFSKSFTVSLFIILYALFNPGVKIIICSGSYRQAKMIFETIENLINSPKAVFLRQCCPNWASAGRGVANPSKGTDRWQMIIGKSLVTATPLTEKIRGYRAQVVVIDEFLAVPKKIVDEIIGPFLTVLRGDAVERKKIEQAEQILIDRGEMKEWQRTRFHNNKMIALSSATYKCEPLYQSTYEEYLKAIHDAKITGATHSVVRMGYTMAPPFMDLNSIEQAKRSLSKDQFDREYNAIFTDQSGGFYNIRDIMAATIEIGFDPKVKMFGNRDKDYIISIDPNSSAGSEDADNFAMSVFELEGNGSDAATLVHGFAHPKIQINKVVEYFHYLMKNFRVVFVIVDNAGGPRFIETYNSLVAAGDKLEFADLDFTDADTFRATRSNYDPSIKKIVYSQVFNEKGWIRDSNDALQGDLQHKKIRFASSIAFDDTEISVNANRMMTEKLPDLAFTDDFLSGDKQHLNGEVIEDEDGVKQKSLVSAAKRRMHVEHVDLVVSTTAKELAGIQMKADIMGNIRFDLAPEMKANKGKDRARRDSYTSFLLGNWGRRLYLKLKEDDEDDEIFVGGFYG